jgi:hypothetical protein
MKKFVFGAIFLLTFHAFCDDLDGFTYHVKFKLLHFSGLTARGTVDGEDVRFFEPMYRSMLSETPPDFMVGEWYTERETVLRACQKLV